MNHQPDDSTNAIWIELFPLPELVPPLVQYDISVCIDVLRATTSMITAFAHGATAVIPFVTIDEVRSYQATCPTETLTGGERNGVRIERFDFGNSPDSYSADRVAQKTILFTTTNGTRAIDRGTGTVILASFLNVQAVVDHLFDRASRWVREQIETTNPAEQPFRIAIICAGTDGQFTQEDLLLGGCIIDRLLLKWRNPQSWSAFLPPPALPIPWRCNVQAETVRDNWIKTITLNPRCQNREGFVETIHQSLLKSRGAKSLLRLHLEKDIADAAQVDTATCVPLRPGGCACFCKIKQQTE